MERLPSSPVFYSLSLLAHTQPSGGSEVREEESFLAPLSLFLSSLLSLVWFTSFSSWVCLRGRLFSAFFLRFVLSHIYLRVNTRPRPSPPPPPSPDTPYFALLFFSATQPSRKRAYPSVLFFEITIIPMLALVDPWARLSIHLYFIYCLQLCMSVCLRVCVLVTVITILL
jgi:hypothetical protein